MTWKEAEIMSEILSRFVVVVFLRPSVRGESKDDQETEDLPVPI